MLYLLSYGGMVGEAEGWIKNYGMEMEGLDRKYLWWDVEKFKAKRNRYEEIEKQNKIPQVGGIIDKTR